MTKVTLEVASRKLEQWLATSPFPAEQKAALDHYGKFFQPSNIGNISAEDFKQFLLFSNNKHWSGIHRKQEQITSDMQRLHECLAILLDESREISSRLEQLRPKGRQAFIPGMGKAVLTPILMCVYPDKYCVYNNITQTALDLLGMFPCKKTEPFSSRYVAVNNTCLDISRQIQQPLYLVDSMFSLIVHENDSPLPGASTETNIDEPPSEASIPDKDASFVFEKHLEEFLVGNWEKTALGKELILYEDDGDSPNQYPTTVGTIDILARDKADGAWVVIELKKGKSSDQVVGQLLRYMGWVKKHKAQQNEAVRGIIITGEPDDRIKYAMLVAQGISFYCYQVRFDLQRQQLGD